MNTLVYDNLTVRINESDTMLELKQAVSELDWYMQATHSPINTNQARILRNLAKDTEARINEAIKKANQPKPGFLF